MTRGINLRINVSIIDKSKLFHGKKGVYLDMTLFLNDELSQDGNNGLIKQSQTKQEREDKVQARLLGDAKIFWTSEKNAEVKKLEEVEEKKQPEKQEQKDEQKSKDTFFDDDIPF